MRLEESIGCLASIGIPEFSAFQRELDKSWIEEALQISGTATLRKRRLPAEQVVWLVIGMALFRDRSICEVAKTLDLAMPTPNGAPIAAPSSVNASRSRVKTESLSWLFSHSAEQWAHTSASRDNWHGLSLYAIDGTCLRVPDSDENREHFGLPSAGNRGAAGYPMVRMVCLMAVRSHLLARADFGPYTNGEYHYASNLWKTIPERSVTILDRNFLSAKLLTDLQTGQDRHWLIPAKSTTKCKVLKVLGKDDELVEMEVSKSARQKNPELPETWQARRIRYQRKGFKPRTLLTSLTKYSQYPAAEVIALYHERWEIELGYRELKTSMLSTTTQPLRSQSPERVRQELWGILIAYNLVRREIERVADEANVEPTRISFVMVFQRIILDLTEFAFTSPGAIPKRLGNLRNYIKQYILPPRRSNRSYERAVKVKMSNYPKKRRRVAEKKSKA